jgi:hypothetical protein
MRLVSYGLKLRFAIRWFYKNSCPGKAIQKLNSFFCLYKVLKT